MPNGLAIAGGVTWPLLAPDGSAAAPSYSFASAPTAGFFYSVANSDIELSTGNSLSIRFASGLTRLMHAGTQGLLLDARSTVDQSLVFGSAEDISLSRLAAASLRLGKAPSATPIAQTFTIGEASRAGTDSNVGGASGTFRSGLGTGTGTASSLLFQTPNLVGAGSTTQTYTTRLTVATAGITATVPVQVPVGAASAPGFAIGASTVGIWKSGHAWTFTNGDSSGTDGIRINPSVTFLQVIAAANVLTQISNYAITVSGAGVGSYGFTTGLDAGAAATTALFALGDASLRLGLAPSATPVAQTFTIGEASRPGTDLNIAGSNGTIRSGLGTGNAAGSSLIFQTPDPIASSTVAQTYGQRLSLSALGATFDIPDQSFRINGQVSGAGASAGTLTNAPAAGNPSFWLPINVGGTVYFFPGW